MTSEDDAFARFSHEHAPRVYMLALRLSGNEAEASDLLSETFVRAWRGLPSLRGDSSANTWLHAIAVRAWRDVRRRNGRPTLALDGDEYGIAAQYDEPGLRMDIEKAVAALPEGRQGIPTSSSWRRTPTAPHLATKREISRSTSIVVRNAQRTSSAFGRSRKQCADCRRRRERFRQSSGVSRAALPSGSGRCGGGAGRRSRRRPRLS